MVKLSIAFQRMAILVCIFAGCAHKSPRREPAEVTQSSPPSTTFACTTDEQDFEEIKALKELISSLPTKLRQILDNDRNTQRKHIKHFEALRLRGRTCDDFAKAKQAVDMATGRLKDINNQLLEFKNHLEMGKKLQGLSQPGVSNEKIFCFMDCEDEVRRSDRSFCANKCGLTTSQAQTMHSLFIGDDDSGTDNCPETREANKEKLKSVLGELIDTMRTFANQVEPEVKRAFREYAEIESFYERQQRKFEQILIRFQGSECQRQDQSLTGSLEENLRRALSSGESGIGKGTLFYIRGPRDGEGIPVTAQHVSGFGDGGRPARDRVAMVEKSRTAQQIDRPNGIIELNAEEFPVRPGQYDAAHDVTLGNPRPVSFALPLVEVDRRPQVGQRFMIAGFPANREHHFTTHRCVFRGYMNLADRLPNSGYLLHCPSTVSLISGMSGGPMVDESGKVWGTVQAADTISKGLVIVTPLGKNPQGEVEIGIRQPMLSDHCYRFNEQMNTERHRCQIFPNSRETEVP